MTDTIQTRLIHCAMALCLGAAGSAMAAPGAMSKDAYQTQQKRIELQQKAEKKACARLKGNAEDICKAEADGKAVTARAQLAARYKPSPDSERDAKDAKAEADYETARQRCDDARGKARDACLNTAKAARDAAIRQAKVEKVESVAELKDKRAEHKPVVQASPAAQYAARKNYCEMKGAERDQCLAEAKRRFNRS